MKNKSSSKKGKYLLPQGKLPIDVLEEIIGTLPASKELVVGPSIGVDVGVTRNRGSFTVSSSDPITGAKGMEGWHAVNVSANDVATSGIMPQSLNIVSLFPERTDMKDVKTLMRDIYDAAGRLGISVAGGHTEVTPGLGNPIVVVTCFGSGERFVTSAMAKEGDSILMTKTAAIEGTSILCRLDRVMSILPQGVANRGKALIRKLSIVPDAGAAFSTRRVHAMHDVTEGGIIGAVAEMSLASKLGFELELDKIPLEKSTREVTNRLRIDPYKLIGSGSLLIACPKAGEDQVKNALSKKHIRCTRIGRFYNLKRGRTLKGNFERSELKEFSIQDELWPALEKYS